MKTLLLLRHAKSSWDDAGLDDHDRPLNKRGKKATSRMGRLLRDEELVPDLVICSSALRARATAAAVGEAAGYEGAIEKRHELYLAAPHAYLDVLEQLSRDVRSALVVGHNPGLEDLLEALCGRSERLPTAALAVLELPIERWLDIEIDGRARCRRVWRPKDLG